MDAASIQSKHCGEVSNDVSQEERTLGTPRATSVSLSYEVSGESRVVTFETSDYLQNSPVIARQCFYNHNMCRVLL